MVGQRTRIVLLTSFFTFAFTMLFLALVQNYAHAGTTSLPPVRFVDVVDTADTTYFRVLKSHLDPADRSNSTLIIEFNNLIDAKSAVKKEDYEIFYEDRKAKILNIDIVDRKAIIRVKEEKIQSPRITCSVRNIKDINGKILNRKNIIEFYQYRELFIQEYNKPMNFKDSCYLQNVPLLQNCISRYAGDKKYWMNTPVNANIE